MGRIAVASRNAARPRHCRCRCNPGWEEAWLSEAMRWSMVSLSARDLTLELQEVRCLMSNLRRNLIPWMPPVGFSKLVMTVTEGDTHIKLAKTRFESYDRRNGHREWRRIGSRSNLADTRLICILNVLAEVLPAQSRSSRLRIFGYLV
jgi:hypothetical protein